MNIYYLVAAIAVVAGLSGLLVKDPQDTLIRAARTAVQTALALLLAAAVAPEIEFEWATNLLLPVAVAGATVIHSAIQPAERPAE